MFPGQPIRLGEYNCSNNAKTVDCPASSGWLDNPPLCSWRRKHHAENSGQFEQRSQKHGGVNRFRGSGAFDLNSQHAMGEEPDSRKDGQTNAEGAMRQSHLPSVPDLIRFTAGSVGFLDHQQISAASPFS